MTKEEKLAILEEREQYAFETLKRLDPGSAEFLRCAESVRRIAGLRFAVNSRTYYVSQQDAPSLPDRSPAFVPGAVELRGAWEAGGNEAVEEAEPPAEPVEPVAEDKSDDATPWDESSAANEAPSKSYTKEEVTAVLTDLRNNHGVDIAAVMQELGFAKLSSVPAERYGELIEKAQTAKENA